ncbi:transporter [Flavobacterium arcticum]|uniref:Transporter n=1 Tax=Flavobacterium arcticum TaxID=1784713 RepID=A0A345H8F3_9FLAO|nr:transporter [Flavobacterium arcticum]AXG72863.1 transporter [Flavobacterium arcticum]KAF2510473.1 transporter [Flavobacterium arcticum]
MKKYIILFIILVSQFMSANTPPPNFKQYLDLFDDCDACGCSASGGGMGFSSMLNQNFVGVRYFYQSYTSRDGVFNNSPWVDENFNTMQLWARIPLSEKFQISAQVPYHFHTRELSTGHQEINGLGDITILGLYTVYRTQKDSTVYNHTLQAGGGLKMPTGEYNGANNGSVNPSFQLGTGSWDYVLAAEYVLKRKKLGLNTMLNYSIKTENSDNYQFGNQWNYATTLFYVIEQPKYTLVPQLGLAGEDYAANKQFGEELPNTKGDILFGKAGVEAGYGSFSVGLNAMVPISQNLTGGKVEANYRWSVNLNYSL